MKRFAAQIYALALLTIGAVVFVGCDGFGAVGMDDFIGGDNEAGSSGNFTLLLTDAPFPFELVSEANVWIDSVDVVSEEDGVTTLTTFDPAEQYNLLELQDGVTTTLFDGDLEPGTYSQVRLYVSSASIVLNDGQTFDLKVPSERIKVLVDSLTIEEGMEAELTLDFDVSESFIVQGNPDTPAGIKGFIFKPVVKPIDLDTDGDEGTGEDEGDDTGEDEGDDDTGDDEGGDDTGDDEGGDDTGDDEEEG